MRKANVLMQDQPAGTLVELEKNRRYRFSYLDNYEGEDEENEKAQIALAYPT